MKTRKTTLLSTAAIALGAAFLLAPRAEADDDHAKLNNADARFIQEEVAAGIAVVKLAQIGETKALSPAQPQ